MNNPPVSQELPLDHFIFQLNEELLSIGASSAEQSFGLAVWLGTLPLLAGVALLLILRLITIIVAFFLVILLFLVFTATTSILASTARRNALQRAIRERIIPQIRAYQATHLIDFEAFENKAREILPSEAPLLDALYIMKEWTESTN
ncbi:MAG: hypothetical protein RML93_10800 [Anaerolineales bacterium]|nr:hypothetical protein [Anaerolineales bacterium]MCS7246985.1 hypothetical protein [Anaerolineales bacterium]MDW8160796.1 hypothetical protein [Anaerolineales bacterium]MDW8447765.1 hypothetical protein [Anaerolineales bacterium]